MPTTVKNATRRCVFSLYLKDVFCCYLREHYYAQGGVYMTGGHSEAFTH